MKKPQVAVLMGSNTDLSVMQEVGRTLERFDINYKMFILSAHRSPRETIRFARTAIKKGFKVIIAGAGRAAHLPGIIAAETTLPVIGVPLISGPFKGMDAFFAMWQMPKGVPVAVMASGQSGVVNAALLAAQILSIESRSIKTKLQLYKKELANKVKKSSQELR